MLGARGEPSVAYFINGHEQTPLNRVCFFIFFNVFLASKGSDYSELNYTSRCSAVIVLYYCIAIWTWVEVTAKAGCVIFIEFRRQGYRYHEIRNAFSKFYRRHLI